jgi:hypothetical protein
MHMFRADSNTFSPALLDADDDAGAVCEPREDMDDDDDDDDDDDEHEALFVNDDLSATHTPRFLSPRLPPSLVFLFLSSVLVISPLLSDEDEDVVLVHVALRQTRSGEISRLMNDSAGIAFNGGDTGTMNGRSRNMGLRVCDDVGDVSGRALVVCGMYCWAGHKRSLRSVIRAWPVNY